MRVLLLLLALSVCPGCLAAAAAGAAYAISTDIEADAEVKKRRLEFIETRKAAGATDAEIVAEIRLMDPDWWREIEKAGGLEGE